MRKQQTMRLLALALVLLATLVSSIPIDEVDCPIRSGPFMLVRGSFRLSEAESVCRARNMTLAQVTDENAIQALETVERCGVSLAWISAFNGLNAMPCMFLDTFFGVLSEVDWEPCQVSVVSVLCEEPILVNVSTTTTTTFTTSYGTVTDCVRVTKTPECCDHDKALLLEDETSLEEHLELEHEIIKSCPTCTGVCRIQDTAFSIIKHQVPYYLAAKACAQHNLTLADISSGDLDGIEEGAAECNIPSNLFVWTRSFNAVDGARYLAYVPRFKEIIFGLRQSQIFAKGYPLCQCSKPAVTGLGPRRLPTTTKTATIVSTIPYVVPETTKTVTQTVIRRCQRKPGFDCRED